MSKLNKKEFINLIKQYREEGKSDKELYDLLRLESDKRWQIFNLIAGTPDASRITTGLKVLNTILLVVLMISIVLKIAAIFLTLNDISLMTKLILCFIASSLNLFFIVMVYKYNGIYYMLLIFFAISSLLRCLINFLTHNNYDISDLLFDATISSITIVCAFILFKKLFPKLRFFGVKAVEGEYRHAL